MKNKQFIDTREQLLAKRAELLERLSAIKKDYANGLDPDLGEQAIQLENAEVLEELSREALEQLKTIEKKLRKLGHPASSGEDTT
jgi:RNA polymerase-binding transcription factor DksA